MRKTVRNMLSLLIVLAFAFNTLPFGNVKTAKAAASSVVISQVYGGGGNTGAPYTHDFIELFNAGSEPVTLNGWSLQYASGTGNFNSSGVTELFNVTIAAGGYYLVQEATNSLTIGDPLPTADLVDTTNLSGTNGKVALVNDTVALACSTLTNCGPENRDKIMDLVGYGTSTMYKGPAAAPATSNTTAVIRKGAGCTNIGSNRDDFTAEAPTPRNSASPIHLCSTPTVPSLSVNDVAMSEGDSGTTTFNFTVSLNVPAGEGGVTFDIATAEGTATKDVDYITKLSNQQAIPAGSSSYTFSVLVYGDFTSELDETFAVNVTGVSGAAVTDASGEGKIVDDDTDYCALDYTPIYAIQGSGTAAAVTGNVTTQGVVVGDFETSAVGSGFYLQDATGDDDAATSDGIFVFTDNANLVSVGQVVRVTGYARERFNQTALNGSNSNTAAVPAKNIIQCGSTVSVTPVDVTMPFADAGYLERFEGMLVRFPQNLVIAEYFDYDRYGEIVLALPLEDETRPFTGTAIDEPGAPANARALANSLRRITLDDNNSAQNPTMLRHPNGLPFSLENRFRGGDTVANTVGVLGWDYSKYRIFPTGPAEYTSVNLRPAAPEEVGGAVRVAAMNTLNYFVTADYPSGNALDNKCGPANDQECRGWDSDQSNELSRQRTKLLKALEGLNADVIGLNELENTTGVEPLADIVAGLPGYAYIDTGTIGTDAIKVGMIYRTAAVTPVSAYQTLDTADDPRFLDTRNRPALAQTFQVIATGEKFTAVVNHFKSKGSECSGDPDNLDGQGNCSQTRANAAAALVDWLASDPTGSGDLDFIILGDLNSYAMEDTIDVIKAGPDDTLGTDDDYTNLIAKYQGTHAYSYTFDGQAGYLDHALASASLVGQVTGATEWHINSDEPDVLDYDTSFKSTAQDALYEENAFRASDHDPVIVGLNLAPPPVNNAPVALDDAYDTDEDNDLTVAAPGVLTNDTDDDGDPITASLETQPGNGSVQMEASGAFIYVPDDNFHGTDTFTYTISDGELTDTASVTITVEPVNDAPVADDDTYETDEDDGLTVTVPGVLANDTDDDGDTLTATLDAQPANGSVVMESTGQFTYTPDDNFHGTDTFTYTISDGELTDTATVTIEVESINDAPVAADDAYETDEDNGLTIDAPGVLANDTDDDGEPIAAILETQPDNGSVQMQASGSFTYLPDDNFHGTDTFTYTVSDGELTDTAAVTITVESINDAPVAADDTYETGEDTELIIPAPGVLANDTDVDGDPLTAQEILVPQHGKLTMTPDGGFLYTPDGDYNGEDSFTYGVSDGDLSDSGTVTITVNAVDDGYYAVITKNKLFPEEGEVVTFTASLVDLDTEQPVDFSDGAVINWSFEAGQTGSGAVAQHAFTDEDTYVVTLNVNDPVYGFHTATTSVPVKNANPTIDTIAPVTIAQREWVQKAGNFTDPGQDEQFTATVDYGDGTGVQPLALEDGTFDLSHQYFTAGDFTITIVLEDGDGGEYTLTIAVTVEGRQLIFLPTLHR